LDRLFDQYVVVVPALIPFLYIILGLVPFTVMRAMGQSPGREAYKTGGMLGRFWSEYIAWMMRPLMRLVVGSRITPNALTVSSVVAAAGAGFAIATGHFAMGTWLYVSAGILDLMDGRLARETNQQSVAGAFLDSVLDRWAELFVFAGFAWQLQGTYAMLATLLALGGSMMVSYTRARGESLGVVTNGGAMQRPERIFLVSLGCLVAALVDASSAWMYVPEVLGTTLAIVGVASTVTAIGRMRAGYRMLLDRAPSPRAAAESHSAKDTPVPERPVARVLRFKRRGDRASGA
jgi:phosphatidylglycerophosphate synthase